MTDKCAKYVNFLIKASLIVCASANFSESLDRLDPSYELAHNNSEYSAVTVQSKGQYIVLFKEPVSLNTIAHEAQHIADFEKLTGEESASLVGNYMDLFLRTLLSEDVKVYYSMYKEDHFITPKN